MREKTFRWVIYIGGLLILALGITLNTKTLLGVSPIVSVPFSVSTVLNLNFGNITLIYYIIFVAIQFILRGKEYHIYDLLQIPVSIFFTRFLNVFGDWIQVVPQNFVQKLIILFFAIVFTGVGISMSVSVNLVPNPGDGIVQAISWRIGKSMGFSKNLFDIICVSTTFLVGVFSGHFLLGIGLGTIAAMIGVGRVVAVFNHFCKKTMMKLSGLEE